MIRVRGAQVEVGEVVEAGEVYCSVTKGGDSRWSIAQIDFEIVAEWSGTFFREATPSVPAPDTDAIMRSIKAAIHENYCGTPPSCGLKRDCEGMLGAREHGVISKVLRETFAAPGIDAVVGDVDLDAIRARAEAATEGPWTWHRPEMVVANPEDPEDVWDFVITDCNGVASVGACDAHFIAHARTDVPALLAVVGELRAEVERLNAHIADRLEYLRGVQKIAQGYRHRYQNAERDLDEARAAVAAERTEWADWIEHGMQAAGLPEPFTLDTVVTWLRSGRKPFGVAAWSES